VATTAPVEVLLGAHDAPGLDHDTANTADSNMQGLPAMWSVFVIVLCSNTFQSDQLRVPVIAEFTSPGPRTIFMRIVDGEGSGSLVETHATPLGPDRDERPRTAVLESGHRAFRPDRISRMRRAAALITP
jgi:hypothetical protein